MNIQRYRIHIVNTQDLGRYEESTENTQIEQDI